MNSRTRNRLIGISAVLAIVMVAVLVIMFQGASLSLDVDRLYNEDRYIGETIQVSGTVVAGSWDRESNPMRFRIFNEDSDTNAEIEIVFSGLPPANFGDGTQAIIRGLVEDTNLVTSTDMVTVCPSRYETDDNTLPVYALFDEDSDMNMVNVPVRISARVVPGSITPPGTDIRFHVMDIEYPEITMPVMYTGGLADTIVDETPVVITGTIDADGVFTAEIVAHIADS